MRMYARAAAAVRTGEICIYGDIGANWAGVTVSQVRRDIREQGEIDALNVRINSPGGDVLEGTAIFSVLRSLDIPITVDIDGAAMSIASLIAVAGDEVRISEAAFVMVHEPWTIAYGNADEMLRVADSLEKARESMLNVYTARRPISRDSIEALMSKEAFLTADEALAAGLVDSVTRHNRITNTNTTVRVAARASYYRR
jgi:ATP-dependent Clp protease, protease subunit